MKVTKRELTKEEIEIIKKDKKHLNAKLRSGEIYVNRNGVIIEKTDNRKKKIKKVRKTWSEKYSMWIEWRTHLLFGYWSCRLSVRKNFPHEEIIYKYKILKWKNGK